MIYNSTLYKTNGIYKGSGVYNGMNHHENKVKIAGVYYQIVTIGDRVWMAENLRYKTTNSVGRENNAAYGQYYGLDDIAELQSVIPAGWRIPSVDDGDVAPLYSPNVEALQSTGYSDWPNATNESGFSAVPGGAYLTSSGTFPAVNEGKSLLLTSDLSRAFIVEANSRTIYAFGNNAQYYKFNIRLCKDI